MFELSICVTQRACYVDAWKDIGQPKRDFKHGFILSSGNASVIYDAFKTEAISFVIQLIRDVCLLFLSKAALVRY